MIYHSFQVYKILTYRIILVLKKYNSLQMLTNQHI
nr:MAG TPA: hypothetical protein [Caudoviricetes sp.]